LARAAVRAAQIYTHGKRVSVPAESLLTFKLDEDLALGVADTGFTRNGFALSPLLAA